MIPEPEDPRMVSRSVGSQCKIAAVESASGDGTGASFSKMEMAKWEGVPMSEEKGRSPKAPVPNDDSW